MFCLHIHLLVLFFSFFFFNDTATTEIYTLSLHDALPILVAATRTVLAFRRDDLGYRLNKINLAKTNFVRVAIFQFRAGYEDEFADAIRTRARMYEANDIEIGRASCRERV